MNQSLIEIDLAFLADLSWWQVVSFCVTAIIIA